MIDHPLNLDRFFCPRLVRLGVQAKNGGFVMDSVLGLVRHAGNDSLFRALEMSLLATVSGLPLHLHAEGLRGTGKTTMMRSVKRVLPRILRIKGCLYNCDPARPHCPAHRSLAPDKLEQLGTELVPMPFLEISHSAKVGTVVGSIDLGRLVSPTQPEAALLPGTIPQAHRGIIFVDEINRLAETAPELADVLLDVMGTKPGRVQIEETGLPAVEFPVQVTVWAASNPDEDPGPLQDIRRQLSDRFDFGIHTKRPGDASVVAQILSVSEGAAWEGPKAIDPALADTFRSRIEGRLSLLQQARVPDAVRAEIAEIYNRHDIESLRAVQAIQMGLKLHAAMGGREEVTHDDLMQVVDMALYHRTDYETRTKVLDYLRTRGARQGEVAGVQAHALAPEPPREQAVQPREGGAPRTPAQGKQTPPEADQAPEEKPQGFMQRLLASLKGRMGEPQRAEGRPSGRAGARGGTLRNNGGQTPVTQASQYPPKPGRLYQNAPADPPGQAGAQGRPESADRSPAGAGTAAQPTIKTLDPTKVPPVAPPNKARQLTHLLPHEMLRTEEELGNR